MGWIGIALAMIAGCGVETYRERAPAPDLTIRMVAVDGQEGEVLPRAVGQDVEMLAIARAIVVDSDHIRHVRLLDAADGSRVLVLDLDDIGRDRLREASQANIGGRIAVVAGGRIIAAPTIQNALTENEAYIAVPRASLEEAFTTMTVTPP